MKKILVLTQIVVMFCIILGFATLNANVRHTIIPLTEKSKEIDPRLFSRIDEALSGKCDLNEGDRESIIREILNDFNYKGNSVKLDRSHGNNQKTTLLTIDDHLNMNARELVTQSNGLQIIRVGSESNVESSDLVNNIAQIFQSNIDLELKEALVKAMIGGNSVEVKRATIQSGNNCMRH